MIIKINSLCSQVSEDIINSYLSVMKDALHIRSVINLILYSLN